MKTTEETGKILIRISNLVVRIRICTTIKTSLIRITGGKN
jgi:hypothetical protein